MIKDSNYALLEAAKHDPRIEIILNTGKVLQKEVMKFPTLDPKGVLHGVVLLGQMPKTLAECWELEKDWRVLNVDRSLEKDYTFVMSPGIASGVPVVANIVGQKTPVLGTFVITRTEEQDQEMYAHLFLEPVFDENVTDPIRLTTKIGDGGIEQISYKTHNLNTVISWAYLTSDGAINRPPVTYPEPVHLVADCEFDDETRSLISVGIVNDKGEMHYAFDSTAAGLTTNQWIQDNVNSVLFELPPRTIVTDLNATKQNFSQWLTQVIKSSQGEGDTNADRPIIFHVDFPTDVSYLAERLHLGMGHRIGIMKNVDFKIHYVDGWPCSLEGATQHNAMWDAVAIWYKMGMHIPAVTRSRLNKNYDTRKFGTIVSSLQDHK